MRANVHAEDLGVQRVACPDCGRARSFVEYDPLRPLHIQIEEIDESKRIEQRGQRDHVSYRATKLLDICRVSGMLWEVELFVPARIAVLVQLSRGVRATVKGGWEVPGGRGRAWDRTEPRSEGTT